ncbi:conserved hypothetical protein [Leishmania infantum JPCM5]|uniref:Uncharacterized protein n=2 Tax=Leishmania infantum TaxID=5671 RepID=A4ID47_LEIIN|nr:conserved hypothetical protein [Leishmania infantum JPCM5]CAC9551260.1 hypothetical_protein_-_conserved [Leishmania infantum]CAM72777.1 conserved hypothetical protein [Leishmania infantum JPCM5]SUZ46745.1 hypothetical_protein_-_conserved [Leishmania infantum]|eukprot:XP_001469666.1 conserved hypothetical protein [Leishmania infantum JPCM5]
MADPFLDVGNPLELEVTRLTQENRELRQENARLRARISLTATPSETASNAVSERSTLRRADDTAAVPVGTSPGAKPIDKPGGALSHRFTRAAETSSPKQHKQQAVSTARIEEAVQRVKKELRGEVEKYQKAAETKASQMEQLKQQFELFVTTTCEREAAYELVYMQVFRELEEQRALARIAQAQLEEQRLEAVEMRTSLQAAAAAAAAPSKCSTLVSLSPSPPSKSDDVAVASSSSAARPVKRCRTGKTATHADDGYKSNATEAQTTQEEVVEVQQEVAMTAPNATPEPRQLRIVQGGAALRADSKTSRLKRPRASSAMSVSSATRSTRTRQSAAAVAQLHMPASPVFAAASVSAADISVGVAVTSSSGTAATAFPAAASASSPARRTASDALGDLWTLLARHTEATHGFLPLWQHLARLRGSDRLAALRVMIPLLLHLLGPADATIPLVLPAPLSASVAAPPTSITVLATAIRLLEVQLESEAQQQRGAAVSRADATAQHCSALFHSLFYRICVATLRRWQTAEAGADAVDNWATALIHLYGFQPALSKLVQYTNSTIAYERTHLAHSWVTYTAQAIFAQCLTSSSTSSAEVAVARWRELCDSIGWSPHSLPLERLEAAAARCVARTRVGLGSFTAACAEEALLSLRLVVLYRGFDHMERIAALLEMPGVLPMVITKEIYAELVSLAVMDRAPFRTTDAIQHALRLLREYVQEVSPERCTSAEHFVSVPRLSHLLAALALLRVESTNTAATARSTETDSAFCEAVQEGRQTALRWLQAQKVALNMVRQSAALARDRQLLLRDTVLGQRLLRDASATVHS